MAFDFDTVIERRGSDSLKWARYAGRDVLPLWVADMDFAAPPVVLRALQQRIAHGVFGYAETTQDFLAAVTGALLRDYGWQVAPEHIVPLPGLVVGLNVACRATGEVGDDIVTAAPVYPPFFSAPVNMGRSLTRVALDEKTHWAWDIAALERAHTPRTRGLLLSHPHNPLGRVWHDSELLVLAEHARRHQMIVVSDEIHCDLILESGRQHRPFAVVAPELAAHAITLMAPSKTYNIPGLSAAFAVITDATLRVRFQQAMAGIVPHVNVLGMVAATAACREGMAWRSALLAYLRGNRELVMALDGVGGMRVVRPEATYLAWLDCRGTGIARPQAFFEAAGVGLSDGVDFGGKGFVRLNFGCPRSVLEQALQRMRQALESAAG